MRRISVLLLLLVTLMSSCGLPSYVPEVKDVGSSPYGSYIKLRLEDRSHLKGELLAVDHTHLTLLNDATDTPSLEKIALERIRRFELYYAASPSLYGALIPVSAIVTLPLGLFWPIVGLANVVVTTTVAENARTSYRYTESELPADQLYMFARFPQGLPPQFSLDAIRPIGGE